MSRCSALRRTGVRVAAVAAVTTFVAVTAAVPASAHVTVSSPDAKAGGYAKLVFRVPTESDTASTSKLTVTMPTEHPFASVRPQVKPGWTVKAVEANLATPVQVGDTKLTKAVATVTFTAAAGGIPSGSFDEFALSVGRLPEGVDALSFPAEQTYSDGKVVRWDQPVPASGDEPEHPAPTLKLAAADTAEAGDTAGTTPVTATADSGGGSSDTVARALGIGGLVLGAVGVAFGLRRRPAPASR